MRSMYNNQMQGRQVPGSMMQGGMPNTNMQGGQVPMNNMYNGYQSQHSQYIPTAYNNQMQGQSMMGAGMQNNQYQNQQRPIAPNSSKQPVKPVQISSIKFNNNVNQVDNGERTVLIFDNMDNNRSQQASSNYVAQNQQTNQQSSAQVERPVPQIVIYGTAGEYADAAFALTAPITFGRSKEKCNLAFKPDASGVSRVHCKVSATSDGNVLLQDLGSSYGVKINNDSQLQPGESVVLAVGCSFTIGSNETFEICAVN